MIPETSNISASSILLRLFSFNLIDSLLKAAVRLPSVCCFLRFILLLLSNLVVHQVRHYSGYSGLVKGGRLTDDGCLLFAASRGYDTWTLNIKGRDIIRVGRPLELAFQLIKLPILFLYYPLLLNGEVYVPELALVFPCFELHLFILHSLLYLALSLTSLFFNLLYLLCYFWLSEADHKLELLYILLIPLAHAFSFFSLLVKPLAWERGICEISPFIQLLCVLL